MSYYVERRTVWEQIQDLLTAFYNAIRNGFANLVAAIRRMLARLGYYTEYSYHNAGYA